MTSRARLFISWSCGEYSRNRKIKSL